MAMSGTGDGAARGGTAARPALRAALRGPVVAAALLAAGVGLAAPAMAQNPEAGAYLAARQADSDGDVEAAARLYMRALRGDPENPGLLESATLNLLAGGRVDEAVEVARRLTEIEPGHRVANLALVATAMAAGEFDAARARLAGQAQGFHPLTARLLDAWAVLGTGDAEGADAALAALDSPPLFRVFGAYHLGLMRQAQGDHEGALEALDASNELSGGQNIRLTLARTRALEALGRGDEARAALTAFAEGLRRAEPVVEAEFARIDSGAAPEPLVADAAQGAAEALFGVASALAGEGGRRFALAHAQLATRLRPDLSPAWLLIAELIEAEGHPEQALAAYERIPADDPTWLRAQIGRASALQALERHDAAAEALRAAAAARPRNADAHLALADLLRRREQWAASAEAATRGLEIEREAGRDDWTIYYQRGIAYERDGQWDKAEADFLKALEMEPDQPLVLNYLGYSWVEQRKNLDEARAMIEKAVELRPEDGYITDSLGWVLYRLGDYEGAVEWLERAVELEPTEAVINDHLGDALWMVGRRLEAQFQWRRARSLNPEPADLARIKRKLAEGLDAVLADEAEADARARAE
jgi:tetratricopeptide (TPR) repeat protein